MDNSTDEDPSCSNPTVKYLMNFWIILYLLLLPLFLYVLYVGYKQWQKHQSAMSHSDVFTFIIISMELLTIVATCFYCAGVFNRLNQVKKIGSDLFSIGVTGQMLIHCLTCAERYLAVVHPITYLHLKKRGGVTVRNISIASVWFLSFGSIVLNHISVIGYTLISMLLLGFIPVTLVAFCSVYVLCVLIRPGPGKGGGHINRVDQSKRRALFTIMIILAVLMVRFVFFTVSYLVLSLSFLTRYDSCVLSIATSYFYFPSSLVLPVMFLHKAKKLPRGWVVNKRNM